MAQDAVNLLSRNDVKTDWQQEAVARNRLATAHARLHRHARENGGMNNEGAAQYRADANRRHQHPDAAHGAGIAGQVQLANDRAAQSREFDRIIDRARRGEPEPGSK